MRKCILLFTTFIGIATAFILGCSTTTSSKNKPGYPLDAYATIGQGIIYRIEDSKNQVVCYVLQNKRTKMPINIACADMLPPKEYDIEPLLGDDSL